MQYNISMIMLTLIINNFSCLAQQSFSEKILGVWKLETVEKEKGEVDLNIDPQLIATEISNDSSNDEKETEVWFFFQVNGFIDIVQMEEQVKTYYLLGDSTVTLGNIGYEILKLNDDSLVLLRNLIFARIIYNYVRSNKKITPIEITQAVEEKYANGNLKQSGLKEMGMLSGVWIEWYENRAIKSVQLFFHDALMMKVEFDEDGNVLDEAWYDPDREEFRRY